MKSFTHISKPVILVFGNHQGTIQSMLDFDFLVGRTQPSVCAVVGVRQKMCRYFFGQKEVLIKGYKQLDDMPELLKKRVNLLAIMQSGRRAHDCVTQSIQQLPHLQAGFVFAEGVSEQDALLMRDQAQKAKLPIFGPASVGILVGGNYKLGAIGGTTPSQIKDSQTQTKGDVAIISTSGGIVNELITTLTRAGGSLAYATAIGGERFPITSASNTFAHALSDKNIRAVIFFGELGGNDEILVADLYKKTKSKKPCIAYIAGTVGEQFETPQQFGHAKSMAQSEIETASYKRKYLKDSGISVANSFKDFEKLIFKIASESAQTLQVNDGMLEPRMSALFADNISTEGKDGVVRILGEDLVSFTQSRSLSDIALAMFLGKKKSSKRLRDFFDCVVRLLVDHGPQVSGSVNTMVTARAGNELPAAVAAGLLTIGPRFGGAIDQAASTWLNAVNDKEEAFALTERFAKNKQYIPGIGHRKYRSDNPDPRVQLLLKKFDTNGPYTKFAKNVAKVTTSKKAQLILNIDGVTASLLLDILARDEKMKPQEIKDLLETGFCNALFVYGRTVGLIAHYLEQRRLDEGLFRLPDGAVVSEESYE